MNSTSYGNTSVIDETSSENFTTEKPNWDDVIQLHSYTSTDRIIISIFMPIVVIVGIIGNIITIVVIANHRRLRTAVNVYLANLAIADTLFLMLAPDLIWISYVRTSVHDVFDIGADMLWFCRLNIYIVDTAVQVAIFTIFWMSVERFMAICHPLKFRSNKFGQPSRSITICCIMWLVSLSWQARKFVWINLVSSQLPWPDMYNGIPNSTTACVYCAENCEISNHLFVADIFLSLSLIVVVVALYTAILITLKRSHFTAKNSTGNKSRSKSERKVFITVFLTVVVYVTFMAPFGILNLVIYYTDLNINVIVSLVNILRVAAYTNSSVNPIIYNAINEVFRRAFLDVFCCKRRSKTTTTATSKHVITTVSLATSNPAYVHE
ncbi:kappa-type opioid receptor-like [Anneissia japonica]|uniref:kappa-type opioid receptor-like n=1 Tax=Anneissia japonica TaxID=1529436 RepID=UPI00142550B0|nr:kappa-type opioid receptor-like [Anneissia japonica]